MLCALAPGRGAPAARRSSTGGSRRTETTKKKSKPLRAAAVAGPTATIGPDGLAAAPVEAPAAGPRRRSPPPTSIVGKPYSYGGGHAKVEDSRLRLLGHRLLRAHRRGAAQDARSTPRSFMRWGEAGPGEWITVYTNPGHAFVVIAGLRLDTSAAGDPSGAKGPRWRPALRSTRGFRARHPEGL